MKTTYKNIIGVVAGLLLSPSVWAMDGAAAYSQGCASCHDMGMAGAPRFGDAVSWQAALAVGGKDKLYKSALEGTARGMPAKGGKAGEGLTDAEVTSAVDFILEKVQGIAPVVLTQAAGYAIPFTFNRLLRPLNKNNLPPTEDGIHDPLNEGTKMLQPPMQVFDLLPRSNFGNRIDWVAALEGKQINPRWDRTEPTVEGTVMDMNILRTPRGSMPNVIFPHKQHTEWLECSNCHPAIFVPQRGANQISMPLILLGQKCGVCHGKVSFPISECRKCHSQKKDEPIKAVAKP